MTMRDPDRARRSARRPCTADDDLTIVREVHQRKLGDVARVLWKSPWSGLVAGRSAIRAIAA
jgi:hypothetical protein